MKCPYCGNEMVSGWIPGDRFCLKFVPEDINGTKGVTINRGVVGTYIKLTKNNPFFNNLDCSFCKNCNLIIAPIKDFSKKNK